MIIAICDDELDDITQLSTLLSGYMEKTGATLQINTFRNADQLLCSLAGGARFDLIFLDVLMPGINGIQAAKELRQSDGAAELVFLTSTPDFALDAFAVKARDYLVKPINEATLFRLMDDLSVRLDGEETIIIESKKGLRKLQCDRLEYCEVFGHTLLWHLRSGAVFESKESIQRVAERLAHTGLFFQVHRSYIVNLNCITSIDRTSRAVFLENLNSIPVARSKFAQLQDIYLKHMKGNNQ